MSEQLELFDVEPGASRSTSRTTRLHQYTCWRSRLAVTPCRSASEHQVSSTSSIYRDTR